MFIRVPIKFLVAPLPRWVRWNKIFLPGYKSHSTDLGLKVKVKFNFFLFVWKEGSLAYNNKENPAGEKQGHR